MILARKLFCYTYKDHGIDFWRKVFFSDESYFAINLDSIMNRVRRFTNMNPYQKSLVKKTAKHPLKIMIWACFSYEGVGRLEVCQGNMNQQRYLDTLDSKLLPSIQQSGLSGEIYHLDDSATCHRTKKVLDWHQKNQIRKINWPGNSPDLNPIENLFSIMKYKLARRTIKTKQDLTEAIIRIWYHEIDHEVLKKLADSMPSRIEKVLKNKGLWSKY